MFSSREQLKDVPYLGEKTFEQAVGFLRIQNGKEPLDATAIHPESYDKARLIMKKFQITPDMFGKEEVETIFKDINREELGNELKIDLYTLNDIIDAFIAPQRDPRDEFPQPILKSNVLSLEDLTIGLELQGTVRNVVDFGAFIDIGLHEDGLVHISKMVRRYIKHPSEVLQVGQIVTVYVLNIDHERGKVGLTLLKDQN